MTSHAKDIIWDTAERLLNPQTVAKALPPGTDVSLSGGLCGTALLHARLASVHTDFATAAVQHWSSAMGRLRTKPHSSHGIQSGRGGLAASLLIGSQYLPDPARVHQATSESAQWLSKYVERACISFKSHLKEEGPPWHVYDAITGTAATGRVLLAAAQTGHLTAERGLAAALVLLTDILTPRHDGPPGWWLVRELHPDPGKVHPSGAATTGLAHGVAGPLAFLSAAHAQGWSVPGQTDAIDNAAYWLLRWKHPNGTWPPHVTGDEIDEAATPSATGRTDAWCYGTPGITRALTLAGHALGDSTPLSIAEHALSTMATRPPSQWDAQGPTFCHGTAGVLQSTRETNPELAAAAAASVVDSFDRHSLFGFRHHEGHHIRDDPGLLTGAAGTALTLTEYTNFPTPCVSTKWDCIFSLS